MQPRSCCSCDAGHQICSLRSTSPTSQTATPVQRLPPSSTSFVSCRRQLRRFYVLNMYYARKGRVLEALWLEVQVIFPANLFASWVTDSCDDPRSSCESPSVCGQYPGGGQDCEQLTSPRNLHNLSTAILQFAVPPPPSSLTLVVAHGCRVPWSTRQRYQHCNAFPKTMQRPACRSFAWGGFGQRRCKIISANIGSRRNRQGSRGVRPSPRFREFARHVVTDPSFAQLSSQNNVPGCALGREWAATVNMRPILSGAESEALH